MFQIGDKVICIKNRGGEHELDLNEIYDVLKVSSDGDFINLSKGYKYFTYRTDRFISLNDHRKQTILKIKDKIKEKD